jgi:hypothetical protein
MDKLETLREAILAFKQERTKERVMAVLEALANAKDEMLLVPAQMQPTAFGKGMETRYKVVTSPSGRCLHIAYTSSDEAAAGLEQGALAQVAVKDMLFAVSRQSEVDGLVLDPYSQDFVLKKELCEAMVREIKAME